MHVLDDLTARGLIAHITDIDALRADMSTASITYYVGFDPTAPSLHIGNLLQLLTARRLQNAGHRPLILVGGSTGLIGDPKDVGERIMNSKETVSEWVERIRSQVSLFVSFEGDNAAVLVNNLDWTANLSTIDFLRDIGKHFPINKMLAREVVSSRLESGISYTEFSYVLLQSLDYLNLHRTYGCSLQTGGSDQWGNITAGVDLVRRADGAKVHALATPLVTKADGTKFGKTESGTVWLDAGLTSPYAWYQFWLNAEDAIVPSLLRIFSFRSHAEIEELEASLRDRPQAREAQRALAVELTELVHGATEREQVQAAAKALFGQGEVADLSLATLESALVEAPHAEVTVGEWADGITVADALARSGLVGSKGAGRRTIAEGGAYVSNVRVADPDYVLTDSDLLHGRWVLLRRGRRHIGGIRLNPA